MMSLKEYADPNQACLADYIPWALMVASGVVEHKDGALQKTYSFRGPDLDSATARDLIAYISQFNNALRRFFDGWAIFIEAQRNSCSQYPKSNWPNKAAKIIDEERRKNFSKPDSYFKNDYYLTLVFKEPSKLSNRGASLFIGKGQKSTVKNDNLKIFLTALEEIKGLLTGNFSFFHELDDDETLTYLHSTVSTNRHYIKTPDIPLYLDHILTDQSIEHGLELKLGANFIRTITIKTFPTESFPGILDSLNDLGFSFRWMSRFIFLGAETGKAQIDKIRTAWYAKRKSISTILKEVASQTESGLGETSSLRRSEDADEAMQLLDQGLVSFGYFTATVSVFSQDRKTADERINQVMSTINRSGFVCHLETINAFDAWLSSVPGHLYANVRKPIVHTINLAHMAPLSAIWSGEEENSHLGGPPHFIAKCRGNTAFSFSSNVSDVGHTLIFGPTGAGKSTLLSFMAAQWLRYDKAQVFIFDKGFSSRVLTECMGGAFFVVGDKAQDLCFQPLKNIDQEPERIWASEWLQEIIESQGLSLSSEVRIEIWQALSRLAEQEGKSRTLSVFMSLVQSNEVREAIKPFTLLGPYGYLFDASEDSLSDNYWQVFETAELFEKKTALKPALSYLFHRIGQRFDGRPTLLILDEAWLFLENSLFTQKIKQWLKELRKSNVYVIFATQSLSDAMQSPIAMALKESCPTKIFLPNASALDQSSREFYVSLGLNERQIEIIAKALPKKEYYASSPKGNRLFDLALGPKELAICASSSVNDQKLLSQIKQQYDDKQFLEEFLKMRGIYDYKDNSH